MIRSIDSLSSELESSYQRFSAINCDSLQRIEDSIEKHLHWVQDNYTGTMRREMGKHMGEYRMVKKLVPGAAKRSAEVQAGVAIARKQLNELKGAISGEFTHDASGNKLTSDHVTGLYREERTATEALIREMNLITERSTPMLKHYYELHPRVRFWVDSIPPRRNDDD